VSMVSSSVSMVFVFLLKKIKHLIIAREQLLFFEELTMHLIFFQKMMRPFIFSIEITMHSIIFRRNEDTRLTEATKQECIINS
jgi:hypothetical protein